MNSLQSKTLIQTQSRLLPFIAVIDTIVWNNYKLNRFHRLYAQMQPTNLLYRSQCTVMALCNYKSFT